MIVKKNCPRHPEISRGQTSLLATRIALTTTVHSNLMIMKKLTRALFKKKKVKMKKVLKTCSMKDFTYPVTKNTTVLRLYRMMHVPMQMIRLEFLEAGSHWTANQP